MLLHNLEHVVWSFSGDFLDSAHNQKCQQVRMNFLDLEWKRSSVFTWYIYLCTVVKVGYIAVMKCEHDRSAKHAHNNIAYSSSTQEEEKVPFIFSIEELIFNNSLTIKIRSSVNYEVVIDGIFFFWTSLPALFQHIFKYSFFKNIIILLVKNYITHDSAKSPLFREKKKANRPT